jgi:multidrug resistance efflux pump
VEILVTLAYAFLVRLVFFEYRWVPWNLFTQILVFGLYGAAALTEIVLLGQYSPYSDKVFIERPVVQIAAYQGGQVEEIYVKPHEPVKKGDPLLKMETRAIQAQLDRAMGTLSAAQQEYDDSLKLVKRKVMAAEVLKLKEDAVAEAQGDVETYTYRLGETNIKAPADGYVINMQLRPGQFVRLKSPMMSFVSSEEAWLVLKVRQEGSQYIKPGQEIEFALTMYPGEVFHAKVTALVQGVGEAQLLLGGQIPNVSSIVEIDYFGVVAVLDESEYKRDMVFGASGIAAINTGRGADIFWLLRRLEIQSESLLNYVYNPFRG